jgi:hypothetical protein
MDADTNNHQCSCELCQPNWGGVTATLDREDDAEVVQQPRKRTEDTEKATSAPWQLATG